MKNIPPPTLWNPGSLRIGFGTNRLGSLGGTRERTRLLNRVWDLGIRHFDTAPLYGGGDAESWLGDFLACSKDEATVTTKFGLRPPMVARIFGLKEFARWIRRSGGPLASVQEKALAFIERKQKTTQTSQPLETAEIKSLLEDLERSLERSLRNLKRDSVDIFALHEPKRSVLMKDELLSTLIRFKTQGKVRGLAVAGAFSETFEIAKQWKHAFDVYQFEFDGTGENLARWNSMHLPAPVLYGVLARHLRDSSGLNEVGIQPCQLIARALAANPRGLVLFSSVNLRHIEELLLPFSNQTLEQILGSYSS
jgi:D-threo-aldose 1-dehydrogenase